MDAYRILRNRLVDHRHHFSGLDCAAGLWLHGGGNTDAYGNGCRARQRRHAYTGTANGR